MQHVDAVRRFNRFYTRRIGVLRATDRAEYSRDEYRARVGWGHSSMRQAIEFANLGEVGSLIAFHHDPTHHDDILETMHSEIIAELAPRYPITVAKEGETLKVNHH